VDECARLALDAIDDGMCVVIGLQVRPGFCGLTYQIQEMPAPETPPAACAFCSLCFSFLSSARC